MTAAAGEGVAMRLDALRTLARDTLRAAGLAPDHVEVVAETMVAGERDGCASHGTRAVLDGAMRTLGGHKGSALAAMVELLAGPLIGDMTSAESIAADQARGGSPIGGELVIAIDPAGFLGDGVAEHLVRAEAMFAAIEEQGARLPSARRHAARARSVAEGVTIPAALHADILAIGGRA